LPPNHVREERVFRTQVNTTLWDRIVLLKPSARSQPISPVPAGRRAYTANRLAAGARWWATRRDRRAGWYRPAVEAGDQLIRRLRFDVLLSTSPPRVAARVAHELARRHGLPWVMDLRDPYVAESAGGKPADELFRLFLRSQLRSHARRATLLVHNTERLRQLTCRLVPGIEEKTLCIPNGLDHNWFPAGRGPSNVLPTVFRISYYGQIMGQRSSAVFLQGVGAWLRTANPDLSQISIRFVGSGFDGVRRDASALGLERLVEIHPPVPRHEIPMMISDDFVLLLLANAQPMQVPGKTYEYLASGRRIIAITECDSATAEVLRDQEFCVVAESPQQVAGALGRLFTEFQTGTAPWVDRTETVREIDYSRRVERFAMALRAAAQSR
jgi:hypothetical protein